MDESFAKGLESINWFSACGAPFSIPLPFHVERVSDWPHALDLCSGQAWEDVTLEAQNHLTEFLHALHRD